MPISDLHKKKKYKNSVTLTILLALIVLLFYIAIIKFSTT